MTSVPLKIKRLAQEDVGNGTAPNAMTHHRHGAKEFATLDLIIPEQEGFRNHNDRVHVTKDSGRSVPRAGKSPATSDTVSIQVTRPSPAGSHD